MHMEKIDITKILVHNKYRFPLNKDDKAIMLVDISKAADLILQLIKKEYGSRKEEMQEPS